MEKLKELWAKLDLKVAMIGGAIVVTTSLGTCHFTGSSEEVAEPAPPPEAPVEAPAEEPVDKPEPEEPEPEEPAEEADA
tara:strand:+ start:305 stop:541 length:237 start_codon:yes stop_codon:yes gene_type:complete